MVEFAFEPANVTINVGDTVTWTNNGDIVHTATSTEPSGAFDSGLVNPGETFAHTFDAPGTYQYICSVHPNMMGTVVVQPETPQTQTGTATVSPTTATATTTTTATTTATATTTPIAGATTVTLSGNEEVPPAVSDATGQFQFRLDGNTLTWRLVAQGNGQTLTMAHIHLGARGTAGPIVETLFMGDRASVDLAGMTDEAGLEGPLAGDMPGFLEALQAGTLYVNVHSVDFPGGVLRGQLPGSAATPTATGTATGTGTATRTTTPAAPTTGSGLDDGGNTAAMLGFAGLGVLALAGAGGAMVALRRRP